MNGWPALTGHGPNASTPQKPEKRQSLSVVVQALAVSVHEEGLYESASQRLRSLNQILSQLLRHRRVKNDITRVAELAFGNKQMHQSRINIGIDRSLYIRFPGLRA
jgi:hypothetical protein